MLPLEHSAVLLTFIKLPFVIKSFVLSIFEWLFYTGFTVINQTVELDCLKLPDYSIHVSIYSACERLNQFEQNECHYCFSNSVQLEE